MFTSKVSFIIVDIIALTAIPENLAQYYSYVEIKFYMCGSMTTCREVPKQQSPSVNPAYPTKILIHGFQENTTFPFVQDLMIAYFSKGLFNIVLIEWGKFANKEIDEVVGGIANIGLQIANFIRWYFNYNTVTLIGNGVGAHVAGYTGKYYWQTWGIKLPTIIALDPAIMGFSAGDTNTRLCKMDATYVESIQSSGNFLGFEIPIGHASFYPNWGNDNQIGCEAEDNFYCGRNRAQKYFIESLSSDKFIAHKCYNYDAVINATEKT